MASPAQDLDTPVLLLALPQVLDPFFHKSVVLLLHHGEEGSFGFIVNRPTGIRVMEILQGMEISWNGREDALAYFGGPVQPQLGTVLFDRDRGHRGEGGGAGAPRPEQDDHETATEILPGLAMSQHVGDLAELATHPPSLFRLLLGYAGWGAGQLVKEILRNDWLTAPVSRDLLFADSADGVWEAAVRSVGVDPATLPSWTTDGDAGETN